MKDNKDGPIHLIYGTDDNYIFPTMVSAASAAHQLGSGRKLIIHLFDAGVTDEHYADYEKRVCSLNENVCCMRHCLSAEMFSGFGAWRGSLVTYSRMFMAEILPDVDWAIYFDGDTLWVGDIGKLWDLRDETKLIQASIDPPTPTGFANPEWEWYAERGIRIDPNGYLCMGLMLANLSKMREERIAEKCRDFMQKYPAPRMVDQTVINYVCKGEVFALPPEWGVFSVWHGCADLTKDGALHYVDDLPWRRKKANRLLSDVVLLWYEFGRKVLKEDYLPKYVGRMDRIWRRAIFLLIKYNQWILSLHPYLKGHLRNTHGLSRAEKSAIRQRFARM